MLPNGQNAAGTFGTVNNDEVPMIEQGEGGEWNARFSNNNCGVHYSQQGTHSQQIPACNSTQIQKADAGMAAIRREQGL